MTDKTDKIDKEQTPWRHVLRRTNQHLLFSEDLGPAGTKVDVEIIDSGRMTITGAGGKTDEKPWLAFAGKNGKPAKKRLALGVGMAQVMESICGTNIIQNWRGWITLVVIRTRVKDQMTGVERETDAIRIAPTRPKPKQSAPQQDAAQEGAGQ